MTRSTIRVLKHNSILVAVALAIGAGAGAPAFGADLLEIFRLAKSSDAVYGSARAAWAAAQEKLPQGRSGLLPSASISASTQHNDRSINFRDPATVDNNTRFNSNVLSLSIFRFISNFGLGGEVPVALTLTSEFSPSRIRGTDRRRTCLR